MSKSVCRNVNNLKRGHHAEKVLTMLQVYFENQRMCDVVLIAGNDGIKVSAHRIVLSACSLYFLNLFSNNSERSDVRLEEVSGHVLQVLVHFCYSGHIEFRKDNVEIYLAAATLLQLTDVVKAGWDYLVQELHPSYCLKVAQIAEKYNCNDIQRQAEIFTHQHYMQVCESGDFLKLNIGQVCKIIASDDLVVDSEEDAFNSCISWIDHDRKYREMYFPQLLPFVRLRRLPLQFITERVNPLCKTIECKELIIEAMAMHLQIEKYTKPREPSKMCLPLMQSDKPSDEILLAIGKDLENNKCTIHSYNQSKDEWANWMAELPYEFHNVCGILDGGLIIGGGVSGDLTIYDFKTQQKTIKSTLKITRLGNGYGVVGGYLYIVGGICNCDTLNSVKRWNPNVETWEYVAPMDERRTKLAVATLGEHLYAVGGNCQMKQYESYHRSVERYDPQTNKWTLRAPMNKARFNFQVAAGNGYLYAVGGRNTYKTLTDTVERYDPIEDKWTMICSISKARCVIGCAVLGDRLIAVGGHSRKGWLNTVEEFDFETNHWTAKKKLAGSKKYYQLLKIPRNFLPTLN